LVLSLYSEVHLHTKYVSHFTRYNVATTNEHELMEHSQ
jgi:hypothetical protein